MAAGRGKKAKAEVERPAVPAGRTRSARRSAAVQLDALAPALVLALLLSGCFAPPGASSGEWRLHGSFTAERTQADIDAVCAAGTGGNTECALMESFPEQFAFVFASQVACEDARAKIATVPHTNVGECRRVVTSGEPEAPTSSGR